MGCDIHAHVEIKIDGKWEHWSAPEPRRNYLMFALLAGVRNYRELQPIAPVRGLPKDMTKLTAMDYHQMAPDAHTASWIGMEEMRKLEARYREVNARLYPEDDNPIFSFEHWLGSYLCGNALWCPSVPEVTDVRLVFWFDN